MKGLSKAELESACRKNPLVFGMAYVDLLDGKEWDYGGRRWAIEPYLAMNPADIEKNPLGKARRMAITKSTQAGISTMALVKMLHALSYWEMRAGYMLPRQKDLSDFSSTRLDPIINNSEYLRGKRGTPNSVYTKKIGNSYIFFLEGSVEPRSMPMDVLYLDEVDLCNSDHVGTAINRLDASPWKLITYLSTPTFPMTGIDAVFETSDQREWFAPCPHCGHKQVMDWDAHLRVDGSVSDPTKVWYACEKCKKEITVPDMQAGEWVPKFPSRSDDTLGYHISQMMTTPAADLYKHYRDPNQSISEFHRKRLGRPFTLSGGSIERSDIITNCFEEPYDPESEADETSRYYMGLDQGNQLQVVIGKVPEGKKQPKIVHIELIPFEKGFERAGELMRLYRVKRAVFDGSPNRHSVKEVMKSFPGRVLMADYIESQRERYFVKKDDRLKIPTNVTLNRTEGFDDLVGSIKKGWLQLPGDPVRTLPEVETFIDQMTSIKRDVERRVTASGTEVEVAVWHKLRADHLAHATLYMKTAVDSDSGGGFRVANVNANKGTDNAIPVMEDGSAPHPDIVDRLVALLAEVPKDQLRGYLMNRTVTGYEVPFPLSYKLPLALETEKMDDIIWVMLNLIKG